jgi:hypothetical protein
MVDRASGFEATMLLMAEGQHAANFTVAGTIVDHARGVGKPMHQLISDEEIRSAWQPPDLAALNNSIGEDQIAYLLNLGNKAVRLVPGSSSSIASARAKRSRA